MTSEHSTITIQKSIVANILKDGGRCLQDWTYIIRHFKSAVCSIQSFNCYFNHFVYNAKPPYNFGNRYIAYKLRRTFYQTQPEVYFLGWLERLERSLENIQIRVILKQGLHTIYQNLWKTRIPVEMYIYMLSICIWNRKSTKMTVLWQS